MLKFFRKIRQRLLSENRVSKYLLYAVGEIILVVIGILIALQINNWNEYRINSDEENAILVALMAETHENQTILTQELRRHRTVLRLVKELSDNISPEPKSINTSRLDSLIFALAWLPVYTPNDGVLNSVISSGKISLVKNDVLKSKLASWNSLLSSYNQTINWSDKDVFEIIVPYIKDKYPYKRTLIYFEAVTSKKSSFQFSQEDLLSDMTFESIVTNRVIDAKDALLAANKLYALQEEVLNLISNELND